MAAYVLAAIVSFAGAGYALQLIALDAQHLYHHRPLMAALVGAAAAGLTAAAAVATMILASLLSRVLRFGPRARLPFRAAAGLEAAHWLVALYVVAGAVAALFYSLLARPRMLPAYKALNVALWMPAVTVSALALAQL